MAIGEVPATLVKKRFDGGLYVAYTINFPDFHEWNFLIYQADYHHRELKNMGWPELLP